MTSLAPSPRASGLAHPSQNGLAAVRGVAPAPQSPPAPEHGPLPGRRRALLTLAVLAAVSVLAGALAWRSGGNGAWVVVSYVGAILTVLVALIALFRRLRSGRRASNGATAVTMAYPALVLAAWLAVGCAGAKSTVHVDNYSNVPLRLELDGREWLECGTKSTSAQRLRRGTYELTVRSAVDGTVLDRRTLEVGRGGTYVLNLLGAQTYYSGRVYYGGSIQPPKDVASQTRDVWFETKADFVFTTPPGRLASREKGLLARSYLLRGAPLR